MTPNPVAYTDTEITDVCPSGIVLSARKMPAPDTGAQFARFVLSALLSKRKNSQCCRGIPERELLFLKSSTGAQRIGTIDQQKQSTDWDIEPFNVIDRDRQFGKESICDVFFFFLNVALKRQCFEKKRNEMYEGNSNPTLIKSCRDKQTVVSSREKSLKRTYDKC
ncbi:hypothetical protein CDAR_278921 [Caerostris darwini]|uniref:Uncharacterized protein n=1 Tax=Caerostris darwini TaxID=1538125 RepID=A0AAV4WS67_9ARAC|nr:hypothetical protein CDAR_278921 [Caerostris darwini]